MKPSLPLCARIRFTTKEVGRGFYRGNRTGAMGAHTEWGGYLIDWRRVRHYNVPELSDFTLTPFVSKAINPREKLPWTSDRTTHYEPKKVDGVEYLREWKNNNPEEYDEWVARLRHVDEQQTQAELPAEEAQQDIAPQHEQTHVSAQIRTDKIS